MEAKEARIVIWENLLKVAKPDSRFSWQFSEFITDYEGSEDGAVLMASTEAYKTAKTIFITPIITLRNSERLLSEIRKQSS